MKIQSILIPIFAVAAISCTSTQSQPLTVKDRFSDKFLIGAAIPVPHVKGMDVKADSIVTLHYNSIVAENCMKSAEIHPKEDQYNWADADAFVEYGEKRNMAIIGHCLVWHSQLSPWFPYDSEGNYVTPEVMKERMREHITTVVSRYKGKIHGWDVVNEAIEDDGSYRKTPFYEILGEEFIPLAFEYAHQADPEAELYINDFSMAIPEKRETYLKIIKQLKDRGLRIDGIGMQSHIGLDYPDMAEYEKSITEFGNAGVDVMITELDLSALPTLKHGANVGDVEEFKKASNPYTDGLPIDVSDRWNARMKQVFDIYKKHADVISRVTFWGTHDGMSWRNDWPMRGRTDYPLPFDRQCNMKQFLLDEITCENN